MKVAVIGGGLFGCTAAIHLAREGHTVHLYEKSNKIMQGASMVNQLRFHEGYHYPRSDDTVEECQNAKASFIAEYGDAVLQDSNHYYAIAWDGSLTSPDAYEDFMDRHNLPWRRIEASFMDRSAVSAVYQVTEDYISYGKLWEAVEVRLDEERVSVFRNRVLDERARDEYDQIVVCAYAGVNQAVMALGCLPSDVQYEVVEKPIIKMPVPFRTTGVVVMDGAFFSVDPYDLTPFHVFGHVEHAIWSSNVGEAPKIPAPLRTYMNKVVPKPRHSRFEVMREHAAHYMPMMSKAEHISSMFTVRAVLPFKDATDERPTIVSQLDEQVIRVFSGKLTHCVEAARQVCDLVDLTISPRKVSC